MKQTEQTAPTTEKEAQEIRDLETSWHHPGGVFGWLSYTTHQAIGMRYIVTAFIFLLAGGIEALLMRIQLARANNTFLGPDRYNEIFTTHGTTMMFLFAVPMMEGMAIYLVPLMLGTRNVAFPRLNAFGYWMYLAEPCSSTGEFSRTLRRTQDGSPIRRFRAPSIRPGNASISGRR
jgi:hypothetical protein